MHLVGKHLTTELKGVLPTILDWEGGLRLADCRGGAVLEHDGAFLPSEAAHNLHEVDGVLGGVRHCRLYEHLELVRGHLPHLLLEQVLQKDRKLDHISELSGEGSTARTVDYLNLELQRQRQSGTGSLNGGDLGLFRNMGDTENTVTMRRLH